MIIDELFEAPQLCPECGGISFSNLILAEKKDACYHKVKASAKVWPSAYASGRLVQCRKKGAANDGNKSEGVEEARSTTPQQDQDFRDQADYGGEDPDARDRYGNLKRSTSPGLSGTIDIGGVSIPAAAFDAGLGSVAAMGGLRSMFGKSRTKPVTNPNASQDIATQRDTGQGISSIGGPGKAVTSTTVDNALVKLGGNKVSTTSGPTVTKPPNINSKIDAASDVPAYVRQGKPDPVTTPANKLKIKVRPGETMDQAVQRTKSEQEFDKFLQGQGGQKFGNPSAAQATSGPGQVPTIRLPDGSLIVDPYRLSPSGNYNTPSDSKMDKIMKKWDQENSPVKSKGQRPWGSNVDDQPGSVKPSNPKSKNPSSKWLQSLGGNTDKKTVDEEQSRKKRKEPEAKYDDQYDAMVARVRKLAGIGPMKTVWDPARRVYKNVPTADQLPKK